MSLIDTGSVVETCIPMHPHEHHQDQSEDRDVESTDAVQNGQPRQVMDCSQIHSIFSDHAKQLCSVKCMVIG